MEDREMEKSHGGARKGAGRKRIQGTDPKAKTIKLSMEHWNKAWKIGNGNMVAGIRLALDLWHEQKR